MPEVEVRVGGRAHKVACGVGQEDQVRALAARVSDELARICGGATPPASREAQAMLLVALMLADKLEEAERAISSLRAEQAQTRLHAPAAPQRQSAASQRQAAPPPRPDAQRPDAQHTASQHTESPRPDLPRQDPQPEAPPPAARQSAPPAAPCAAPHAAPPARAAPRRADRSRIEDLRAERDEVANACASLLEEAADEMQRLRARLAG